MSKASHPVEDNVSSVKKETRAWRQDLTGRIFGKLTVLKRGDEYSKSGKFLWSCICECGATRSASTQNLKIGTAKECLACLHVTRVNRMTGTRHAATHGKSKTREFRIWRGLRQRCSDPNSPDWHKYGGRGITVDPKWDNSFLAFLSDVGLAPSPKHSIDRINNDGNYEPANCRWATPKEQCNNKRTNRIIEYRGKRQTVTEWTRELGFSITVLFKRLERMSIDDAFTRPMIRRNRKQQGCPQLLKGVVPSN